MIFECFGCWEDVHEYKIGLLERESRWKFFFNEEIEPFLSKKVSTSLNCLFYAAAIQQIEVFRTSSGEI